MKKKKFAAVIAFMYSILGIKELPKGEDGNLAFSDDQEKRLQEEFGDNFEAAKKAAQEVLEEESGLEDKRKAANEALAAALDAPADEEKPIEKNAEAAAKVIEEQKEQIKKLASAPEADEAVRSLSTGMKNFGIKAMLTATTATAFLGQTGKAFSMGSPWNKRAHLELTGKSKMAAVTDFTDVANIARLNDDLKEYYVQNPEVLNDLRKNRSGLPEFWPKRFNVVDQVSDAVSDVTNVTQARKPGWSPNPEFFIGAEKRKIYPVQIDVEFTAEQLQQLETSWIHTIISMDGSSPYKLSFVAYLIKKIDDQARIEDRISAINGVYVYKPEGIKAKGSFLNRQNGLRYQLMKFRDMDKKIIPFRSKLGAPTAANMYDYIKEWVNSLANDVRIQLGLKFYISQKNLNAYQEGYKLANGLFQDYKGNDLFHVEGYNNIEFVVLTDLEGSDIMFITDKDNIEIMEDVPNEKSIYRFEYLKRDTFVHADYKFAVAFKFAGFKLPENSPFLGLSQMIWVNDVPAFSENFYVPMYGTNLSAPVDVNFTRVQTDVNLLSDVVVINSELPAGTVVKISGNVGQLTTAKLKKKTSGNGGNLDLTVDFDPKTGGYLLLIRTTDGFKELSRTSAPEVAPSTSVEFTGTTINAIDGSTFVYKGTAAATLADILNGLEGTELKIFGQDTNTITVAAVTDKILLTGSSAVLTQDKFIVLKKFENLWVEISRG